MEIVLSSRKHDTILCCGLVHEQRVFKALFLLLVAGALSSDQFTSPPLGSVLTNRR